MFYGIAVISIVTFIIFGIDKRKAVKHQRRIPESTLLSLTFLGGTIGALLGMLIFRHKISKRSFLLKFGLIVLIQAVFMYYLSDFLNLIW
ncbi:DUF1294 domain-containing protein [Chryseobacterium shandongense]|uniref:DUF1294 domain-containing protein n=1 Tax=Chryseobacterium shandongense TaxID=1493872 RepID=A0AAD0YF89_9FLAO|nr:DUF1294 domain-containing protein [Chryseobacterium shandongense]AZA85546.1 DUF1294 domain-containing protein [Chryseobacterium shandongense]AZA97718.1 DUF1294 domain-containing protein [Chryseobacterium shandongense]